MNPKCWIQNGGLDMERKRVLITETINREGIELLEEHFDVDIKRDITKEELAEVIEGYDALIVRSNPYIDEEVLQNAGRLQIIGRAGNGIDNIKLEPATKKGVIVANTPDSNSMSACELAIGLILAQARNIAQADVHLKNGGWSRDNFMGSELYGKTLGIIGLGRIGSLVARRMAAFDMKIVAYDPYISDERFERFGAAKRDSLRELLEEADFITIHTPRTTETIGLIGDDEIAMMKQGVRVVNAARGGIIDERALYRGLTGGKIASAGLDVHEKEPCKDNPLFALPNVIVTPHIGATTHEAQKNVGVCIAQQVIKALSGEIVPNAVNLPTLHRDELESIRPYINLMEDLGKLYYQFYSEPIDFVDIKYWGSIANQDTEMIDIAFLKGLLEPVVMEGVNYINARLMAEERGIKFRKRKDTMHHNNYTELITVSIKHRSGEFTLAGNVSSKKTGKLVEIEGYEVDVCPSKHMIFIQNIDVPGVVGNVGRVLGEENINIATMQVGRNERGEKALMVLNVDDEASEDTLAKLVQKANVLWAKAIRL